MQIGARPHRPRSESHYGPASVELRPQVSGSAERNPIAFQLSEANQILREMNPLGGFDYCSIEGSSDVLVIAVYRSTLGDAIEAYTPETVKDTQFSFLVQAATQAFDGVALVNTSTATNQVQVLGFDAQGHAMGQIALTLNAYEKGKWLISDWFITQPQLITINTQYPCVATILCGSLPHEGLNALWSLPTLPR